MDEVLELKRIGQRIREGRIAKDMSQADLAFAADVSVPHISDIERGKVKMSVLTFRKIIEVLKLSADSVLRPDVPTVNQLYQQEFSDVLKDCTPAEIESILKIVREVKVSLHNRSDSAD